MENLGKKEEVAVPRLPQIPKEEGEILYQALGWLAREGKIDFHRKEGKTFISLNHEESVIFQRFPTT